MKKKLFIATFAIVAIAVASLNTKLSLDLNRTYDLSKVTLTAMSDNESGGSAEIMDDNIGTEIDGGELPGVTIECDTGGSGDCYNEIYIYSFYDQRYYWYCEPSGNPKDYCVSNIEDGIPF